MSAFIESIEHYCDGLTVAPGAAACCSECRDAYGIPEDMDDDTAQEQLYEYESGGFSWCQCDSCGSTFGGDRHEAHGIEHDPTGPDGERRIYHLSICTDCLLFWANGDEPEEWYQHPSEVAA